MCNWWEPSCALRDLASKATDNWLAQLAQSIVEATSKALIEVSSFWTSVGSPDLEGVDSATSFVRGQTLWLVLVLVAGSTMWAGIQMAWTQRGEPARDLLRSLFTMVITSTAGVAAAALVVVVSDAFSQSVMDTVVTEDEGGLAGAILGPDLMFDAAPVMLIIIVGLVGLVSNVVQLVLMWGRSALLILLVGMFPLAGAATNTKWGAQWLQKVVGWGVAAAAFKPAASIVYAVAVKVMASSTAATGAGEGILQFVLGVALMVMAVLALPALVSFIVPLAGAVGSGGGGGLAAVGQAAATGAVAISHVKATGAASGGGGGSAGRADAAGPAGKDGSASGATGADTTGSAGSGASAGPGAPASQAGSTGQAAGAGASAAGASAAGGPAAMAIGAGIQAATGAARGVQDQAQSLTGSPSGSGASSAATPTGGDQASSAVEHTPTKFDTGAASGAQEERR
jgi:hypothetical protein